MNNDPVSSPRLATEGQRYTAERKHRPMKCRKCKTRWTAAWTAGPGGTMSPGGYLTDKKRCQVPIAQLSYTKVPDTFLPSNYLFRLT